MLQGRIYGWHGTLGFMDRSEEPYAEPWLESDRYDEPAFEDGPIVSGRHPAPSWRGADGGGSQAGAPSSSPGAVRSLLHGVLNFFKGIGGIVGVFFAVLAFEIAGYLLGTLIVGALSDSALFAALPSNDQLMVVDLVIQAVWLAGMVPWWRRLRGRGIGLERPHSARGSAAGGESPMAQRAVAVVFMGVALQIIVSILLSLILPLFPEVLESYDSMMDDSGTTTFGLLGVLSVAVMAPVVEEMTFRGVAFQYALRAVSPAWCPRLDADGRARLRIGALQFWIANILQALAFGIMHLNIVQGVYAFAIGLVCGWVFWRTGELRWSMGLHAALNFSSYFVSEILTAFSLWGCFELGQLVFPVLFAYWGVKLFARGSEDTALR